MSGETATPSPRGSSNGPLLVGTRLKWHHIYYLLAAFDVATVCFSLYLNHQILGIYTESVGINQEWAERNGSYTNLAQLTAAVNAPGNDVFDTLDVKGESTRLTAAMERFDRALRTARTDLARKVEPSVANELAAGLDRVDASMRAMVSEAWLIFRYFEQDEPEMAGKRMAEMDRTYNALRNAVDDLQGDVRVIQERNFRQQTSLAVSLGRYEHLVGGFIVLMVVAITLYGHKLARKMESDQRERNRFLQNLQEAEARTRAILDTAAEGIVTTDERQRVTSFNAAAESIFGYRAREILGGDVNILLRAEGPAAHEGVINRFLKEANGKGRRHFEVEGQRNDGTTLPLDLAVSEVQVGDRRIITAMVRDITDRKRAEALTRLYSEELEATVRERTQGLEQALAKQAELANKNAEAYELIRKTQEELVRTERLAAVGELAATIAHGIRNPLASIRSAAEVGRDEVDETSTLRESLDDVVLEVNRLEGRIGAVLDLARPFEPNLALSDLNEFIHESAEGLRERFPETVNLDVELDPEIPALEFDRAQLHEVLEAVVINAIEAMEGKGKVIIRSAREAKGNRIAAISVTDTGPGIEPSRIGRIFDLFYSSKPSGTGIGLAVAKRLVESQGGTIGVESRPGRTTFTVRLRMG